MNFEERVLFHEFQLNDTDDMIVDYIRKRREELNSITIKQIAADNYTAPNTVMRLCKKLGYKGFAELKVLLAEEKKKHDQEIMYDRIPKSIMKTLDLISYDQLLLVADKIKNARTCHFIGVGDSRTSCEMMVKNLMCQDKNSVSYVDYLDIDYRVKHCHKKDILFFISVSGENERLLKVAREAKERGICIISIKHFSENSLSKIADILMFFWREERMVNGYNVTDRLGLELLLRQLSEVFWRTYWI